MRPMTIRTAVPLLLALAAAAGSAEPLTHDIRPGGGVTRTGLLSGYFAPLAGTPGDTPVYVMEGSEPGGTLLLLGGTHANEIAAVMAAVLTVERGTVSRGRLIVIPHANNSAARRNEGTFNPASPQWIDLTTRSGETRRFSYGGRYTQAEDQGPDPDVFRHYPSGSGYEGIEARNLDRNHPGKADGTLTQRISHALFRLVEAENVDVLIDLHESSITSRLAFTLVCHPRALEIGAMAKMDLELEGINLALEASREEFYGLSHREFGDRTKAYAFLIETPNPGMEKGIAKPDVVNDHLHPLSGRVCTALKAVFSLLANHALMAGDGKAVRMGFPFPLDGLAGANLGDYLR